LPAFWTRWAKAEGILGSIAGDDTIFTTPARGFTVKDLYDAILVCLNRNSDIPPLFLPEGIPPKISFL
jgi:hypothetical protein